MSPALKKTPTIWGLEMNRLFLFIIFFNLISYSYSSPIVGGKIVADDSAQGVFNIFKSDANGEPNGSCTASKIGTKFIITAAHCVYGKDIKTLGWSNSSEIDLTDENTNLYGLYVKNVNIHPSYELSEMLGQSSRATDIAILEVDMSKGNYVEKFQNLPSMELDFDPVMAGEKLQTLGYGCEAPGDYGNPLSHKKSAELETLPYSSLATECAAVPSAINKQAFEIYKSKMVSSTLLSGGKASLCDGDSGGPTLRNGKIVGINSSLLIDQRSQTEEAYLNLHSRISEAQTWINNIIR